MGVGHGRGVATRRFLKRAVHTVLPRSILEPVTAGWIPGGLQTRCQHARTPCRWRCRGRGGWRIARRGRWGGRGRFGPLLGVPVSPESDGDGQGAGPLGDFLVHGRQRRRDRDHHCDGNHHQTQQHRIHARCTRNNEHPLTTARLRRALARVLGGGFCQFHCYRIILPHCPPGRLAVESAPGVDPTSTVRPLLF